LSKSERIPLKIKIGGNSTDFHEHDEERDLEIECWEPQIIQKHIIERRGDILVCLE